MHRACIQLGYQTQRSIPQGGPESVQKFELVQDPTLRVLTRQLLQAPFYSRGPDSCLRAAKAKGFVDDTIALAPTAASMQHAADAVSMGLLVSGMYLNTKKLRLLSSADTRGAMITYDSQWVGTITPYQGPEAMAKVLGIPITLDGKTTAAFRYSRDKLRKAVESLGPRRSRIRTKLNTLSRGTHMATLYVSQHVSFSDEEQAAFNELSLSIPRRYRYVSNLIAGVCLTTPALGGSFTSLSDATLRRKQRLIGRLLAEPGDTRVAMQGVLLRGCRRDGIPDTTMLGCRSRILGTPSTAFPGILTDLALACYANGITIDIEGIKRASPIIQVPPPDGLSKQLSAWLDEYGIATLDELIEWEPDGLQPSRWVQKYTTKLINKDLTARIKERIPQLQEHPNSYRLLRGHVLGVTLPAGAAAEYGSTSNNMAIILLGFLPDSQEWSFTPWYSTRLDGCKFRLCPGYIALGAGGNYRAREQAILAWHPRRMFYSELHHGSELIITGVNPTICFREDPGRGTDQFGVRDSPPRYLDAILQALGTTELLAIATDASYRGLPHPFGDIFRSNKYTPCQSTAAVLIADNTYNPLAGARRANLAITVTGLTSLPGEGSAAKGECIASLLGLQIRHWTTGQPKNYTNCQALVTGTRPQEPLNRTTSQLGDVGGLMHSIRRYREHFGRQVARSDQYFWCQSHPEKRMPQNQWGITDWLIWTADHYADFTLEAQSQLCFTGAQLLEERCFEVSASDVLRESWSPGEVTYRMDGIPMVGELITVIHDRRVRHYLENRERVTTNSYPWTQSQLGMLQAVLRQSVEFKTVEARGRSSKFIWDHIGHGRNQRKWDGRGEVMDPCPLCGHHTDDM